MLLAVAAPAHAADHEILMLNKGAAGAMVFEPAGLRIAPGDTVTFVPTDKGHNVESIKEVLPEGAEAFKGGMGKEVVVTFTQEGLYGIKCLPHFGMGMVAAIVVGDGAPTNLAQTETVKLPGKAKDRFAAALVDAGL
ncbi:MAG: pseudoazurin [Candidatus Devosia phytovorans]|uniref:Pseudoazurin n=1 Tax=Candidatus Devosia phytovorans TaxID=3121372 RepID=A0AAJ5VZK3_9HYPH|nr:pseudoazurin [Devosia sp.]WEK06780.1 MAG: pseudoazurin [Devosia sp.]